MIRYVRLNSTNVLSTPESQSAGEKWERLDELAPCCALINNGVLHKRCSARLCSILTDEVAALQVMSLTYWLSHSPQSNRKPSLQNPGLQKYMTLLQFAPLTTIRKRDGVLTRVLNICIRGEIFYWNLVVYGNLLLIINYIKSIAVGNIIHYITHFR